ncbi:MAG: hypothetical protein ACYCO4_05100 [Sulfobacillus sp.]
MTGAHRLAAGTSGTGSVAWNVLRYGLAGLWTLDALLQSQPGMFTMDMVSTVMQPAATGQPGWLQQLIGWSIQLVTPHLAAFNWTVIALQLAIALGLLAPWTPVVRAALWLSVAWGTVVWLVGEGLGQVLTGSASFLTGAPGSAVFYVVAAALLLWSGGWESHSRRPAAAAATQAVAISLLLAAALQLVPTFWTSLGLGTSIAAGAAMAQPQWLRWTLDVAANTAAVAPVWINLAITVISLSLGVALVMVPHSRWVLAAAVGWLAVVWWIGQDLGALFSGMATDPNTAPVLMLLLWTGWLGQCGRA